MDELDMVLALEDAMSGPAGDADDSIAALADTLAAARGSVDDLDDAFAGFGEAAGSVATDVGGVSEEIAASTDALDEAGDAAEGGAANFRAMGGATRMLGGDMGAAVGKGFQLVNMFSKMGPEVAIAIVAFAVLAAGVMAVVSIFKAGIDQMGAQRDELLKLTGAMKGNSAAASELQGAITAVSSNSALGRSQIEGYATSLAQAGLKGAELKRALEAMSIAGSAGGEDAAQAFLKSAKAAKAAGQSVDALSGKIKSQLGGVAAAQALGLSVQFSKMGEDISALFGGANKAGFDSFLAQFHTLTGMFSQNTALGQELRRVLGGALDGFFAAAKAVFPYVKAFIMGAVIGALQVYLGYLKVKAAIMSVLGPILNAIGAATGLKTAMDLGKYAVIALAVVFGVLAVAMLVAFLPAIIVIGTVVAAVWLISEAISAAIDAFDALGAAITGAFGEAVAWLEGLDFASIGANLISGLVNGIVSGTGAVVDAVKNLASSAMSALTGALGIHSPSTKMHKYGNFTAEGFTGGVEQGTDAATDAVEAMGDAKPGSGGKRKGGGAGGDGREVHLHFHEFMPSQDELDRARGWVMDVFEQEAKA